MGKFKEIFIFVVGTSPQVITETIYSLATAKPPIYPDEIYIVTTALGKQSIIENLVKRSILDNLINEFNIPSLKLEEDKIFIPRNKDGSLIEDICSYEDNEALGDLITSLVREKTRDENTRLHCSIAGGRKTMSFYLGSALQLFGRPWDKLYHVIVTPEFESNPDFFYKPRQDRDILIKTREGKQMILNTSQAKIILADLPFIRLGRKINLKGKSFRELVEEGQREIDLSTLHPEISVSLIDRKVEINGRAINFSPMLLFIYVIFLKQKTEYCPHPERANCLDCQDCFRELGELFRAEDLKKYADDYSKISGQKSWKQEALLKKWKNGIPVEVCRQYISKINKILREELQEKTLFSLAAISCIKIYASSRYGVRLEKSKIAIN
ncbi:MAG: TIGR02584 family CRISPR-associated protein [Candidatus Aminicenantes bacterium]|nr:TIGR02584 family CRISPR-associated protein [Candidatus Aminicenantes bacterium]